MIASLGKPSVSLVLGGGHSIGVPLAVSANYSFIASTATMTIHPVRMVGLLSEFLKPLITLKNARKNSRICIKEF